MALPVATSPLSIPVTVAPVANSKLVSAFKVVPVIAAADAPPITAPSTVPPSTSTVLDAVTDTGRVIQAIDREYPSTGTGKPRVYSVIGSEIYFRPAPDSGYTAEILYNAGMDLLTSDSQTTTLLTRHPDLYLHGALAEAYGFLLDEARQGHHDSIFTRVLNEVQMEEDRVHYGGSPLTLQSDYGELRT